MKRWLGCGWLLLTGCIANPGMDNQELRFSKEDEIEIDLQLVSYSWSEHRSVSLYIWFPSMEDDRDCALVDGLTASFDGLAPTKVSEGGFDSSTSAFTPFVWTRSCADVLVFWDDLPASDGPEEDALVVVSDGETELSFVVSAGMNQVVYERVSPEEGPAQPGGELVVNYQPSSDVIDLNELRAYLFSEDRTDVDQQRTPQVDGHQLTFQVPAAPFDPPWLGLEVDSFAGVEVSEVDAPLVVNALRYASRRVYFDPSLEPAAE